MKIKSEKDIKKLIEYALKAQSNSYSPYSKFKVGACLLAKSGKIYLGCNIENASYGATNCAERTAIFNAISNGDRDFETIVIIGSNDKEYAFPCGICRQVLCEFKVPQIIVAKNVNDYKIFAIEELLPYQFNKEKF